MISQIFQAEMAGFESLENIRKKEIAMKRMLVGIVAFATLLGGALHAQDIAGDWQGTLKTGTGLRVILHIAKGDNGSWNAK